MPKEKIINTAIDLIQSEGIENVTVRKIADIANVNVAAINYHFGSKDNLINEILKMRLSHLREAFNILDQQEKPPMKRLKAFLLSYTSLLQKYPELTKIVFSQEKLFDSHAQYFEFMKKQGVHKLIKTVKEIVGDSYADKINTIIRQMMMGIIFPIVILERISPKLNETIEYAIPIDKSIENNIDLFLELYFCKFQQPHNETLNSNQAP